MAPNLVDDGQKLCWSKVGNLTVLYGRKNAAFPQHFMVSYTAASKQAHAMLTGFCSAGRATLGSNDIYVHVDHSAHDTIHKQYRRPLEHCNQRGRGSIALRHPLVRQMTTLIDELVTFDTSVFVHVQAFLARRVFEPGHNILRRLGRAR
jgi:hypothetical protein